MSLDKKLAKKLKEANAKWGDARERAESSTSSNFEEVPDGRYLARPTGLTIGESASSGRLQAGWEWTIADGEYESRKTWDYEGLETEDNLFYLGKKLTRLGYELPEDLSDIQDVFDDIIKTSSLCRIRLKTKGEFQNLFIDKVLESSEDEGEDEGDPDEDDIPSDEPEPKKKKRRKKSEPDPDDGDDLDEGDDDDDDDEGDADNSDEDDDGSDGDGDEDDDDDADTDTDTDDEETTQLEVGMRVEVERTKGPDLPGEVTGILDDGKVKILLDNGKRIKVSPEKLVLSDDAPPPEKPKKRRKKR